MKKFDYLVCVICFFSGFSFTKTTEETKREIEKLEREEDDGRIKRNKKYVITEEDSDE